MDKPLLYCAGTTAAVRYAAQILENKGIKVLWEPSDQAQFALFDIPSFTLDGQLRGGKSLTTLLDTLPEGCRLIGGNMDVPSLKGWRTTDLLKKESYVSQNARITAYCALQLIGQALPMTAEEASILVIGWGRIGKVLTALLSRIGAEVTVASRDPRRIGALNDLGVRIIRADEAVPERYDMIVNTAPASMISEEALLSCPEVILMDLASVKGLKRDDVIWARGLPGIHAPKSSGKLIAKNVLAELEALI